MDYRLVLSNLRFFDLQFWVTVDNYISCHGFPEMTPEQKIFFELSILYIQ